MSPAFDFGYESGWLAELPTQAELVAMAGPEAAARHIEESPGFVLDNWGLIELEIIEVIWGTTDFRAVDMFGVVLPFSELRPLDELPRRQASNELGSCHIVGFTREAYHLLFLVPDGILGVPGAATAEPVLDRNDPWVLWTLYFLQNFHASKGEGPAEQTAAD